MGVGISLLLAAAAPAGLPAQIVVIPLTADPVLLRARLTRPVPVYAAPADSPDLRHFAKPDYTRLVTIDPAARSFAIASEPLPVDAPRLDTLLATGREARMTGRSPRRSAIAAGFSLRLVSDDSGITESELGMVGPFGRALNRIALVASEPE